MSVFKGILRRGIARSSGGQEPVVAGQRDRADPRSVEIRRLMRAGDWSVAQALIREHPNPWFMQDTLVGERDPIQTEVFVDWARQDPSGLSLAMLARGVHPRCMAGSGALF